MPSPAPKMLTPSVAVSAQAVAVMAVLQVAHYLSSIMLIVQVLAVAKAVIVIDATLVLVVASRCSIPVEVTAIRDVRIGRRV